MRCVNLAGIVKVDDEGQRLILDLDQVQRGLRGLQRNRGDGSDRIADIEHAALMVAAAFDCAPDFLVDDVNRTHIRDFALRYWYRSTGCARAHAASVIAGHGACRAA